MTVYYYSVPEIYLGRDGVVSGYRVDGVVSGYRVDGVLSGYGVDGVVSGYGVDAPGVDRQIDR
jgi:hypothetical protein